MIALAVILWPVIGAGAFIWEWTREFDLTLSELPLVLAYALCGPVGAGAILISTHLSIDSVVARQRKS